jgi:hypothetical protein
VALNLQLSGIIRSVVNDYGDFPSTHLYMILMSLS